MKKITRLTLVLIALLVISTLLSMATVRTKTIPVQEGFVYGPSTAQVSAGTKGAYIVKYYGYPSTYKEQHIFRPSGDVFNESSYDFQPFDWFYVISNMMFWMALFIAVVSPLTIFWRPKKLQASDEAKSPAAEDISEPVKESHNENTGN